MDLAQAFELDENAALANTQAVRLGMQVSKVSAMTSIFGRDWPRLAKLTSPERPPGS